MPRPKKCRFIEHFPQVSVMKPIGLKCKDVKYNCLGLEEFEALRLADYERLKQIDAAEKMNISRSTFGRIVENARFIVADALLNGKGIIIKGGQICHDSIKLNNSSDDSDTYQFLKNATIAIKEKSYCLFCRITLKFKT